jgi:hypothetical protein
MAPTAFKTCLSIFLEKRDLLLEQHVSGTTTDEAEARNVTSTEQ